jgi:hypothetical protein
MEKITYRNLLDHIKDVCVVSFGKSDTNETICDRSITLEMTKDIVFMITTDLVKYTLDVIVGDDEERLCWLYLIDDENADGNTLEDDITVELHGVDATDPVMYLRLDDEVPCKKDYNNVFFKGNREAMESIIEFANYKRNMMNLWGNYFPDMDYSDFDHLTQVYLGNIKKTQKLLKALGVIIKSTSDTR